jgi:glycosyltransferase involved in cell wall biosynthesis
VLWRECGYSKNHLLTGKSHPGPQAVCEDASWSTRITDGREKEFMNCEPLVSVVIPTYNRTQPTIAAIESVLAQTYSNLEILVVDDGSTDGSGEAIQRFIHERTDGYHEMFFFSQPNQGASAARNKGISKARGEYIAFLDSDDSWDPEKLECQMQALEQFKNECGVCFTDARLVNSSGMDISSFQLHGKNYKQTMGIDREALKSLAESFSGFWVSSLLVRADLARRIGGFSQDISFVEDRDFHFRLALITSVAYVNKQLIRTDRSPSPPGSAIRPWDKVEVQFQQQQHMLEKWLSMNDIVPADLRRTIKRNLGALHSHWANWYLENGRYDEARLAASRAVKYKVALGTTVKWALTWLAPGFARRITPKTRPVGTGGHAS